MILFLISLAISTALSFCLLMGTDTAASFAIYVLGFLITLSGVGVLSGAIKGDVAAKIRKRAAINGSSTAFQIYALIASGHPAWAAASLIVSVFIVGQAFSDKEESPCKP